LGNQAGGRGGYHEDLENPKIGVLTANHAHILKGVWVTNGEQLFSEEASREPRKSHFW